MNLRAKPISGYVTDSAGNVVRSTKVTVKQATGSSQYRVVAAAKTESSGWFETIPLKPGTYDIFESGVMTMRVIHSFDNGCIPCFKPSTKSMVKTYSMDQYGVTDETPKTPSINAYMLSVQIEGDDIDASNNGHAFPMYSGVSLDRFNALHPNMGTPTSITASRFGVEYYYPNVKNTTYRYARWHGLHGACYGTAPKADAPAISPVVIPLTYDTLCVDADMPIFYAPSTGGADIITVDSTNDRRGWFSFDRWQGYDTLVPLIVFGAIGKGDIVHIHDNDNDTDYYGIIFNDIIYDSLSVYANRIWIELWNKQHAATDKLVTGIVDATIAIYHGFSPAMETSDDSVGDRYTVFEDMTSGGLL